MEATGQGGGDAAVAAVGQREGPAVSTGLGEALRQVVGDLGSGEAALELVGCDEDSHGSSISVRWSAGVGADSG